MSHSPASQQAKVGIAPTMMCRPQTQSGSLKGLSPELGSPLEITTWISIASSLTQAKSTSQQACSSCLALRAHFQCRNGGRSQ